MGQMKGGVEILLRMLCTISATFVQPLYSPFTDMHSIWCLLGHTLSFFKKIVRMPVECFLYPGSLMHGWSSKLINLFGACCQAHSGGLSIALSCEWIGFLIAGQTGIRVNITISSLPIKRFVIFSR